LKASNIHLNRFDDEEANGGYSSATDSSEYDDDETDKNKAFTIGNMKSGRIDFGALITPVTPGKIDTTLVSHRSELMVQFRSTIRAGYGAVLKSGDVSDDSSVALIDIVAKVKNS
jgi:hypothetical protein